MARGTLWTPAASGYEKRSRVSASGLLAAAIFFGLSMTPSMVPRAPELQGVLGGVVAGIGYHLWLGVASTLRWLGERPRKAAPRPVRVVLLALAAGFAAVGLWKGALWQNTIYAAWGLPANGGSTPLRVALIAAGVFLVLLTLGRGFALVVSRWKRRNERLLPARVANAAALFAALAVFAVLIDSLALRGLLRMADSGARLADGLTPPDLDPPASPLVSGGPGSPLDWQEMGRWGRSYVASGPTAAEISAFWGAQAVQPIRVYVGLNAADGPEARAQLAFDELVRLGGFGRAVLVVAMPTGSGCPSPRPRSRPSLRLERRSSAHNQAIEQSSGCLHVETNRDRDAILPAKIDHHRSLRRR